MSKPIIRIYRPELTEEERARRMKAIADAAARLIVNTEKERRRKLHENH